MTDFDDEFEDNPGDSDLLKSLRKQLREEKAERAREREELNALRTVNRTRTLSEVLAAKNLPKKVAALYPETAEATPEAVDAWLTEFGEVFGVEPAPQAEPNVDAETQAAHERIAAAPGGATQNPRVTEQMAALNAATTKDEVLALIQRG